MVLLLIFDMKFYAVDNHFVKERAVKDKHLSECMSHPQIFDGISQRFTVWKCQLLMELAVCVCRQNVNGVSALISIGTQVLMGTYTCV